MDFGTSTEASSCVCLELVTQHLLLTVEPTHVIHTALKEWRWIHHGNTIPEKRENTAQVSAPCRGLMPASDLVFKDLKKKLPAIV